jgi:hypothetical protein
LWQATAADVIIEKAVSYQFTYQLQCSEFGNPENYTEGR